MLSSARIALLDEEIHMRLRHRAISAALLVLMVGVFAAGAVRTADGGLTANAATFINWSSYLFNTSHTSSNVGATAITTANASTLRQAWNWTPAPRTTN